MILIPALETVLLLPPRTGSGSLYRAVQARYPDSILLYRHMEADGVPVGYTRWRKIGVVREPVERLWSLYKFCRAMPGRAATATSFLPDYAARMALSARMGFSDWIVGNETVFTDAFSASDGTAYHPSYAQLHAVPETRKSQWITLRPDLGTEVVPYSQLDRLAARLMVDLGRHNATSDAAPEPLLSVAQDHVERFFGWDAAAARSSVSIGAGFRYPPRGVAT